MSKETGGLSQGVRNEVCPGQAMKGPSPDTLTWCPFEELVHLLGLSFDHWQLSHLSWGLRKRQGLLHQLLWGPVPTRPCNLPPSLGLGFLPYSIKKVAGLRVPGTSQREQRQVSVLTEGKSGLREDSGGQGASCSS